jgi:hypothetical protein
MFAEAFDALGGHGIEESTEPLIHKNSTPLVLLLPLNPLLPHATTSLRNLSPSISEFFLPSRDPIPVCKSFISGLNSCGFLMCLLFPRKTQASAQTWIVELWSWVHTKDYQLLIA